MIESKPPAGVSTCNDTPLGSWAATRNSAAGGAEADTARTGTNAPEVDGGSPPSALARETCEARYSE